MRHLSTIQGASEQGELRNVYWLPGAGNPADGLTRARSDAVPLLRILGSGRLNPGSLRLLKRVAWTEGRGCA